VSHDGLFPANAVVCCFLHSFDEHRECEWYNGGLSVMRSLLRRKEVFLAFAHSDFLLGIPWIKFTCQMQWILPFKLLIINSRKLIALCKCHINFKLCKTDLLVTLFT
jgi:hypothetical protein